MSSLIDGDLSQIFSPNIHIELNKELERTKGSIDAILLESDPMEQLTKIELALEKLSTVWNAFTQLNSVVDDSTVREQYAKFLSKITSFHDDLMKRQDYYKVYSKLEALTKNDEQRAVCEHMRKQFRLSGRELSSKQQQEFNTLSLELASLQNTFSNNVTKHEKSWELLIADREELAGVPEFFIEILRKNAEDHGQQGYLLQLYGFHYENITKYADDRNLRQKVFTAYHNRGNKDPKALGCDNSAIILEILKKRRQLANMLGFDSYVEYSLYTKAAENKDEVYLLLQKLHDMSYEQSQNEYDKLNVFAKDKLKFKQKIQSWDFKYVIEKYKEQEIGLTDLELKYFFPLENVLTVLFKLAKDLFSLEFMPSDCSLHLDPRIRFYGIFDSHGTRIGGVFFDLYSRAGKRTGAWMAEFTNRVGLSGAEQIPIAFLTGNIAPESEDQTYVTYSDLTMIFHEFGHTLHHILTKVNYPSVAGINGVAWDCVELPSQIMEKWANEYTVLQDIAENIDPDVEFTSEVFEQMQRNKYISPSGDLGRQLFLSEFDLRLHELGYDELKDFSSIEKLQAKLINKYKVFSEPQPIANYANAFIHVFDGSYACGYYSYLWAEVMAHDAYTVFEEQGITNSDVGTDFKELILAVGGVYDLVSQFIKFKGAPINIEPLLIARKIK